MRREKASRGWRRRTAPSGAADPGAVFGELQRRELRDLETCRAVWQRESDPLALCEALRQVPSLPEWLVDGLLVMLTAGDGGYPDVRKKHWRERTRHAQDAVRAANVAMVRLQVETDARATWAVAYDLGDMLSHHQCGDVPATSSEGMKRVFARVRAGLSVNRGRYYRARAGMKMRIDRAWSAWLETQRALLNVSGDAK